MQRLIVSSGVKAGTVSEQDGADSPQRIARGSFDARRTRRQHSEQLVFLQRWHEGIRQILYRAGQRCDLARPRSGQPDCQRRPDQRYRRTATRIRGQRALFTTAPLVQVPERHLGTRDPVLEPHSTSKFCQLRAGGAISTTPTFKSTRPGRSNGSTSSSSRIFSWGRVSLKPSIWSRRSPRRRSRRSDSPSCASCIAARGSSHTGTRWPS